MEIVGVGGMNRPSVEGVTIFSPFSQTESLLTGNVNKNYGSTLFCLEKKMESCELVCYVLVSVGDFHCCKYRSQSTILHNENFAIVQAMY